MGIQKPIHWVQIAIRAADALEESFHMRQDLPCHQKTIGLCRVSFNVTAGLTGHNYRLPYIGDQTNLFKYLQQDLELFLESCCPRGCKKDVIQI